MNLLRSELLTQAGFVHGFSTRHGGVSQGDYASLNLGFAVGDALEAVEENHRLLAAALGLAREDMRTVTQVHGDSIEEASQQRTRIEMGACRADAIVSREHGIAVGVRTADCVPILLADRDSGAVAAVHAGWRGTVLQIAKKAVQQLGDKPSSMIAVIGPCIGRCCFEVGSEVTAAFANGFGEGPWRGDVLSSGKESIDLVAANAAQLEQAGVSAVEILRHCTYCDREQFFSFRRDGERSGRQLSLICAR
jgi:YfiH family protein